MHERVSDADGEKQGVETYLPFFPLIDYLILLPIRRPSPVSRSCVGGREYEYDDRQIDKMGTLIEKFPFVSLQLR